MCGRAFRAAFPVFLAERPRLGDGQRTGRREVMAIVAEEAQARGLPFDAKR